MLPESYLLLVVIGFIIAFVSAFGLGANDVANSFGTSVGSKVLSLRGACILATICEISGSVLLGGRVSATIRGGIIDPSRFNETADGSLRLMQGQVSSLIGSCTWMLFATFFRIPVSATHSIVGSTCGFGLVLFGFKGIQWKGILKIVASWFLSPLLSGIVSGVLYTIVKYTVLVKKNSLDPALNILPFLYGISVGVNVFSVLYGGLHMLNIPAIRWWVILLLSIGAAIVTGLIVFCFRPVIKRKVIQRLELMASGKWDQNRKAKRITSWTKCKSRVAKVLGLSGDPKEATLPAQNHHEAEQGAAGDVEMAIQVDGIAEETPSEGSSKANIDAYKITVEDVARHLPKGQICDKPHEAQVFSFAQILTATFGSFVHGGNDVANAIGPVMGLWIVATTGNPLMTAKPALWILFYGGVGISVGLWVWGRKVMKTIGNDITEVTPVTGTCIELGSACTVLVASKIGLPISTTHCLVGSVVCVGWLRKSGSVNWRLFSTIISAWVITLPAAMGISALAMQLFVTFT